MCNKRLKSRKIHLDPGTKSTIALGEQFKFKIPDHVVKHDPTNSVHITLCNSADEKEPSVGGSFEFFPLLSNANETYKNWFTLSSTGGAPIGEIELEYSLIKNFLYQQQQGKSMVAGNPPSLLASSEILLTDSSSDYDDSSEGDSFKRSCRGQLSLAHIMNTNEFFLEFFDFLQAQNAHPFLHLWIAIDALLRAVSAKSFVFDESLILDAKQIYNAHFVDQVDSPAMLRPDNDVFSRLKSTLYSPNVTIKETVDSLQETRSFLFSLLSNSYFPSFKETDAFKRLEKSFYLQQQAAFKGVEGLVKPRQPPPSKDSLQTLPSPLQIQEDLGNLRGCKVTCKLLSQDFLTKEQQRTTTSDSRRSSSDLDFLGVGKLSSLLFAPFKKASSNSNASNTNFYIEVFLTHPLAIPGVSKAIDSYAIVRSYADLLLLHKNLRKAIYKVAKVVFPERKTSTPEKRFAFEAGVKSYLCILCTDDYVCDNADFRSFLLPNAQEQIYLKRSDLTIASPIAPSEISLPLHSSSCSDSDDSTTVAVGEQENLPPAEKSSTKEDACKQPAPAAISNESVELLVDCFFSLLMEVFDLTMKSHWLRKSVLNFIRQITRQTHLDFVKQLVDKEIAGRFSSNHLNGYLMDLERACWPQGKLKKRVAKSPQELEELFHSSKEIFLRILPDSLMTIFGSGNASITLSRFFHMAQFRDYNKRFIYEFLIQVFEVLFQKKQN